MAEAVTSIGNREITYNQGKLADGLTTAAANFQTFTPQGAATDIGSAAWMQDFSKFIQSAGRVDSAIAMRNQAIIQDINQRIAESKTSRQSHDKV